MLEQWRSQTNLINLIFGIVLFLSPWLLGFAASGTPAWNAWISGAVLAGMSLAAIMAFAEWEEWIDLLVGLWILVSPWVLGYPGGTAPPVIHVLVGIVATVLAAAELWKEHHPSPGMTA